MANLPSERYPIAPPTDPDPDEYWDLDPSGGNGDEMGDPDIGPTGEILDPFPRMPIKSVPIPNRMTIDNEDLTGGDRKMKLWQILIIAGVVLYFANR